jgi:enediyne biosynthesis protein E4
VLSGTRLEEGARQEKAWPASEAPTSRLYRNNHDGTFADVTDRAGLRRTGFASSICAGDYDNDGGLDLFVTYFGRNVLYRNRGDGSFEDVTERAGLGMKNTRWGSGCTFVDYDRDGRLDLFVANYLSFDLATAPEPGKGANCLWKGIPVNCGPKGLPFDTNLLYRNRGDGTFEDVSDRSGVAKVTGRYSMTATAADFDGDGWPDIYVACDSTAAILYRNNRDGTFTDAAMSSGVAYGEFGSAQAGMGLAVGDYDNDGRVDFHITNFSDDSNVLYHNDGEGNFTDVTFVSGLGEVTIPFLGWGTSFLDFDNDGWLDIFVANGHVYPVVDANQWGTSFAQQPLLFRNLKNGKFERVGAAPSSGLAYAWTARGLAVGDLDGDGRPDAVLNNIDSKPAILRNVTMPAGHWIDLRLVGDINKKGPRDAIGSIAYVTTGKIRQRREVVSGAVYCSQNDMTLHFGLGTATKIDKLEIQWANGPMEVVGVAAIDKTITIIQSKAPGK